MNNYIQGPRYENITKIYEVDYIDNNDVDRLKYNYTNKIIAYPNFNHTLFKSEPINLKFIVPEIIDVTYCEYPLIKKCDVIHNIIKPASYDLGERLRTNNILKDDSKSLIFLVDQSSTIAVVGIAISMGLSVISLIYLIYPYNRSKNILSSFLKQSRYELKIPISGENKLQDSTDMSYLFPNHRSKKYRIIMIWIFSGLTIILSIILVNTVSRIQEFYEKIQP